jgi:hypothetical protein
VRPKSMQYRNPRKISFVLGSILFWRTREPHASADPLCAVFRHLSSVVDSKLARTTKQNVQSPESDSSLLDRVRRVKTYPLQLLLCAEKSHVHLLQAVSVLGPIRYCISEDIDPAR